MAKALRGFAVVVALCLVTPSFAQEEVVHPNAAAEAAAGVEGEQHITNWWSFDFGEKTKDPTHEGWPPPLGWAFVNFAVFLGILSRILWKPLQKGWVQRHVTIKHELAEATRLRKAAEVQLAEYAKKVSHVDDEVQTLLTQLKRDAENDRARIIAAAEAEALRLKADADRQIGVEIERARAELRKETVEAALKAAKEILKSRITADDQKRLTDDYVASVEARSRTGAQ